MNGQRTWRRMERVWWQCSIVWEAVIKSYDIQDNNVQQSRQLISHARYVGCLSVSYHLLPGCRSVIIFCLSHLSMLIYPLFLTPLAVALPHHLPFTFSEYKDGDQIHKNASVIVSRVPLNDRRSKFASSNQPVAQPVAVQVTRARLRCRSCLCLLACFEPFV
eukprot:m.119403 g.119403  ORF g.119403 m.119403 type:complete len:162 (-) comp15589_c0_seq1:2405-2890(-)